MMSTKEWVVGMVFWGIYLMLGATFYFYTENALERDKRLNYRKERIEIYELLKTHYITLHPGETQLIFDKLESYCGRPVSNTTLENDAADGAYLWNPFNAILFCFTVVSTVGYGNLAPTSPYGRILMIFYALIGIPFNAILFATIGEYFSRVIHRIRDRYKTRRIETKMSMFGDIAMYIGTGILVFIFLPACAFVYMEQWTWDLAIYYAFVTISTIGFGDFVAAQQPQIGHGETWFTVYRILLLTWMIFGLGYFFMILGFLTRGLRSKRLVQLEQKLARNIKETQARVWHGVTKDIGYLRRILNEIHLQRVKPVYRDEEESRSLTESRTRASSEPNLLLLGDDDDEGGGGGTHGIWRRRTTSEAIYSSLPRVMSDSDLQRIDRAATFRDVVAAISPLDLLAHVVSALGAPTLDADPDKGVDGFSEEDILASEGPKVPRPRAASEVRIPMDDVTRGDRNAQWTWSGAPASRHIHELMRARGKRRETISLSEGESKRRESSKSAGLLERWHSSKKRHKAKSLGALFLRKSSGPPPVYTQQNYMTHTTGLRPPSMRDDAADVHSVLEETSVADFLRALTSLHDRVGVVEAPPPLPTSLTDLFSPLPSHPSRRRFSCRRVSLSNRSVSLRNPASITPPPASLSPLGRRFSMAPPSYSSSPPTSLGARRSSMKPSGTSPGSARGIPRQQQPLRPRFKIGPYESDVARLPPRSRHDTS